METIVREFRVLTESEADAFRHDANLRSECERDGVDLGLLLENLTCTPEMRWKRHQNALRMALAFRKAGQKARGE
jgi:hypothetical protein